jgi:phosphatidate cytidylyltransferase
MSKRLMLGPLMILLLLASVWLDQLVDGMKVTAWLASQSWLGLQETFPPGTLLFFVCLALAIVSSRELGALLHKVGVHASRRMLSLAAIAGLLVTSLTPGTLDSVHAVGAVATAGVIALVSSLLFHSRHKKLEGIIAAAGGVMLSFVYLGLMFGFLLAIRREHHVSTLVWIILCIKSCDIGAYFTGKAIGKHKLIAWLSPGKTWEGLVGGVITSGAVGACCVFLPAAAGAHPPWWQGALLGAALGLAGQIGDLLESMLKRDAGAKDSGSGIPGFGGVLDVLDSLLLGGAVAFWVLWVWQRAGVLVP